MLAFAWDHCFWSEQKLNQGQGRGRGRERGSSSISNSMSPVTIQGMQRQYTVQTVQSYLFCHSDRTSRTLRGNVAQDSTYHTRTGACRRSEDVTAALRWAHPGLPLVHAKDAQPTAFWCELRPRPVIVCRFPITEPCRPCAQFCGVRGHMSLLYLGE